MAQSRLPVDEMIKSAGSFASAILLLGFQHLSGTLSSNGGNGTRSDQSAAGWIRKLAFCERFTPRSVFREIMTAMWHAAEFTKQITSGSDALFAQELQNKLEAFCLFEYIDYALHLDSSGPLSLSQLVARAARLDSYFSVWATEGIGHYFADAYLTDNSSPHSLMSRPDSLEVPRSSLVALNAGLGLALAEWLLETANREQHVHRHMLTAFVELCLSNCSPGYEGVGFEALGLAARTLYPHLISAIDSHLSCHDPDLLEYFWHGVGRALYFSPTQFLPFCSEPWHGLEMCLQEPGHPLGRRNAVAGFVWALTLVNVRHPEIVAEFLDRNATHIPEPEAFVNGLCSALLIWSDAQPGQRNVDEFIDYQPNSLDRPLSRLWTIYVQQPWIQTLQEHSWDDRHMGRLFRYQSLVGVGGLRS
jgi:hypothetical protein